MTPISTSTPRPLSADHSSNFAMVPTRPLPPCPTSSSLQAPTASDLRVLAGRGSKGFAHLKILLRGIEVQLDGEEKEWDRFVKAVETRLEELEGAFGNVSRGRSSASSNAMESGMGMSEREIVEDSIRQLSHIFNPPSPVAQAPRIEAGEKLMGEESSSAPVMEVGLPMMPTEKFWNRRGHNSEATNEHPRTPQAPVPMLPTPPDSSHSSVPEASSSSATISQHSAAGSESCSSDVDRAPDGSSSSTPSPPDPQASLSTSAIVAWDQMSLSSGIESLPATIHPHSRSPSLAITFPQRRTRRVLHTPCPSQTRSERSVSQALFQDDPDATDREPSTPVRQTTPTPAPSDSTLDSNIRGSSLHSEQSILDESQGSRYEPKGLWPRLGANTVRGRMSEVACDSCGGRVHWACAGFSWHESLSKEPWCCPLCEDLLDTDETPDILPVPPKDRCIRPNCILRSARLKVVADVIRLHALPISRRPDEDDEYHFERIIGRKVVRRTVNGVRVFEYLVQWQDPWPIYDSTWEPRKNIPDLAHHEGVFLDACKKHDLDITCKIILLPEATEWWDESGRQMREKLDGLGVEPRRWWESELAKKSSKKRRT